MSGLRALSGKLWPTLAVIVMAAGICLGYLRYGMAHEPDPSTIVPPGVSTSTPVLTKPCSTAAAFAAVTCGNGGWVIWGIRGSRLAIKCV